MTGRVAGWLLLGFAAAFAAQPVLADEPGCGALGDPMRRDMCMSDAYDAADAALNAAYVRATRGLRALERDGECRSCAGLGQRLVDAQRHWVAFRDSDCDAVYQLAADGTDRNPARMQCLIDHTRLRTGQITRQFDVGP